MKSLTFIILALVFLAATCNKTTTGQNNELMEVEGYIERTGITSYQYGSHTLTNNKSFYALKSPDIDLTPYEGKTITILAKKVEGYPVDNGPEYLEVKSIKKP